MKSLFLGLTFLLASFSGTTDVKETVAEEFVCGNWVEVKTDCGNDFWLCSDQYEATEEMIDRAEYFAEIKC